MSKFRFEDLEKEYMYRFAEQLRAAGLSISNNIAEGSGLNSNKEFLLFLNYSHRSAFEVANIVKYRLHFALCTKPKAFEMKLRKYLK